MPLSQIIVTSRYLKSGSASSVTKRKNYTKYIATRETVEKREQNQYDPNARGFNMHAVNLDKLCMGLCLSQICCNPFCRCI